MPSTFSEPKSKGVPGCGCRSGAASKVAAGDDATIQENKRIIDHTAGEGRPPRWLSVRKTRRTPCVLNTANKNARWVKALKLC
jgi:hypothetical protein